jgi:AcrR family transcriptional regulator
MTPTGVDDAAPDGRSALISAAGRLFATNGVNGVSLREIMRAAGQRNTTALQYHFGDRNGLLRAVLEKHSLRVSTRRHAILDQLESKDEVALRDLASAFLLPLVPELRDDMNVGPAFLQIAAQLVNKTTQVIDPADPAGVLVFDPAGSIQRWSLLVEPLLPPETVGPPLHRRFAAIRFGYIELGRRSSVSGSDDKLFTSHLTDLFSAVLSAEVSGETRRLLRSKVRSARKRP